MTKAKRIMFGLLMVLALATAGYAQDTQWNNSSAYGDWSLPGNWTAGVPTNTMEAWINNGGFPYLSGTSGSAGRLVVGYSNSIQAWLYLESNASLTITNDMLLGVLAPNSWGRCSINAVGSTLSVGGNLTVGDGGFGLLLSYGTLNVAGGLIAGNSSTGYGGISSLAGNCNFGSATIGLNGSADFSQTGGTASVTNSLVVGDGGRGKVTHSGGQMTAGEVIVGMKGGSQAEYDLKDNGSLAAGNLVVGQGDPGTNPVEWGAEFNQGPSTVNVSGILTVGAAKPLGWTPDRYSYAVSNGTLNVHDLVVGAGTFNIKDAAALINVSGDISFGADGRFIAVENAAISMTGVNFLNTSTTPDNLVGLGNLALIFTGGAPSWKTMEVAGMDYGATDTGFVNNFHMANLTVNGNDTKVSLLDAVNNGNRGPGNAPEALYVNTLNVNPGATLNLNNLPLYTYLNGGIHRVRAGEGSLFGGGRIINSGNPLQAIILLLLE